MTEENLNSLSKETSAKDPDTSANNKGGARVGKKRKSKQKRSSNTEAHTASTVEVNNNGEQNETKARGFGENVNESKESHGAVSSSTNHSDNSFSGFPYSVVESKSEFKFGAYTPETHSPEVRGIDQLDIPVLDSISIRKLKFFQDKQALKTRRVIEKFELPQGNIVLNKQQQTLIENTSPFIADRIHTFVASPNMVNVGYTINPDPAIRLATYDYPTEQKAQDHLQLTQKNKEYHTHTIDPQHHKKPMSPELTRKLESKIDVTHWFANRSPMAINHVKKVNNIIKGINKLSIENTTLSFNDFRAIPNLARAVFDSLIYDGNMFYLIFRSLVWAIQNENDALYNNGVISNGYKRLIDLPGRNRNDLMDSLNVLKDLLKYIPHTETIEEQFNEGIVNLSASGKYEVVLNTVYNLILSNYQPVQSHAARTSLGHMIYHIPVGSLFSQIMEGFKTFDKSNTELHSLISVSKEFVTEFMAAFFIYIKNEATHLINNYKARFIPFLTDLKQHDFFRQEGWVYVEDEQTFMKIKRSNMSSIPYHEFFVFPQEDNDGKVQYLGTKVIATSNKPTDLPEIFHEQVFIKLNEKKPYVSKWFEFMITTHNGNEFEGFSLVGDHRIPFVVRGHSASLLGKTDYNMLNGSNHITFTAGRNESIHCVPLSLESVSAYEPNRIANLVAQGLRIPNDGVNEYAGTRKNMDLFSWISDSFKDDWHWSRVSIESVMTDVHFVNPDEIPVEFLD